MHKGLTMLHCSAKIVTCRVKISCIIASSNFWCVFLFLFFTVKHAPKANPQSVEWFPVHTRAGKLVEESHGEHLQDVLHESGVRVKVRKLKTFSQYIVLIIIPSFSAGWRLHLDPAGLQPSGLSSSTPAACCCEDIKGLECLVL